jgi:hypothetical protein
VLAGDDVTGHFITDLDQGRTLPERWAGDETIRAGGLHGAMGACDAGRSRSRAPGLRVMTLKRFR